MLQFIHNILLREKIVWKQNSFFIGIKFSISFFGGRVGGGGTWVRLLWWESDYLFFVLFCFVLGGFFFLYFLVFTKVVHNTTNTQRKEILHICFNLTHGKVIIHFQQVWYFVGKNENFIIFMGFLKNHT